MVRKTPKQEEVIDNLENFTNLEKKFLIFLKIIVNYSLMMVAKQNKMKLKEQDLKY